MNTPNVRRNQIRGKQHVYLSMHLSYYLPPRRWIRLLLVPSLLLLLPILGCGGNSGPATDGFNSVNPRGGAAGVSNFSSVETSPASSFSVGELALPGGLRTPPLELKDRRLAVIYGGDDRNRPGVAILYNDSILWRYPFPPDQYPMSGLAADSSGTIYTVTGQGLLKALSPEGGLLWEHPVAEEDTPEEGFVIPTLPLAVGSGVIVGDSRGNLVRFKPDGRRLWQIRRGASVVDRLAADPVHGLVVGLTHNSYAEVDTLLLLDPLTGGERWGRPTDGARLIVPPVITPGHILIGLATADSSEHRRGSIAAFSFSGGPAWKAPVPLMPRGISCDNGGNSYISCSGVGAVVDGGGVISFDSLGHLRWQKLFGSAIAAPVVVSSSLIQFISRRDGRTGLFTYNHAGIFREFVSIDAIPDVLAEMTLLSYGQLLLAGLDKATLIRAY